MAYDEYSKVTNDEIIKEQLEARQKFIWDTQAEKAYAVEEGIKKGHKQGVKQMAKLLKDQNISIDIIIATSGLTKEEIDNL